MTEHGPPNKTAYYTKGTGSAFPGGGTLFLPRVKNIKKKG
jgi:hypothetical protein